MSNQKPIDKQYLIDNLKNFEDFILKDDETITVIDTPESYSRSTSGVSGAIEVIGDDAEPTSTQVKISVVQPYISDITEGEYVEFTPAVTHDETVRDYKYMLKKNVYTKEQVDAKITAASTGMESMTPTEFNNYYDNLVITAKNYIDPSQP